MEIDLSGLSVLVAIPTNRSLPPKTVMSLVHTIQNTTAAGIRANVTFCVSGAVEWGRNVLVNEFLRSDYDKLFWIDSDMVWDWDQFARLLALSTLYKVVGATYPAKVDGPSRTYVSMIEGEEPNEHGLSRVDGMGLGFTIMDREVLERAIVGKPRVRDAIKDETFIWVMDHGIGDGEDLVTEDVAFFRDLRRLGYDVWMDGTMRLGHIGEREWRFPEPITRLEKQDG